MRIFNMPDSEGTMALFVGDGRYESWELGTKSIYRWWFTLDVGLMHIEGQTVVCQTKWDWFHLSDA